MADQDIIQTTALAVVEQQQKIVGSALVGSAGAGALAGGDSQGQFDILEQIRELQLKSFRGIKEVVTKLSEMLAFDENVASRTKEDANELAKENQGKLSGSGSDVGDGGDEKEGEEKAKGLAALSGFFAGLPGVAAIGKLLTPITAFFGKSGMLFKLFGRFGPLGAIILGVTLLVKYSSEISKALAPAIDGLKNLFTKMKPAIDFFMMVIDGLIKGVLIAVGTSLKVIVGSLEMAFSTFVSGLIFLRDLVWGLITGDLELIKSAFTNLFSAFQEIGQKFIDVILGAFTGMINGIGELFGFKNLIDPLKAFFTETIPNVFNEAIENFKIEIKKDIDFAIGRFNAIFTAIGDGVSFVYDGIVKGLTWVADLPGRIIGFVADMFSPIIDFFAGIGNRIKIAVNGIIDSLPLPDFVKDKMKFDVQPTKAELDTAGTGDAGVAEKIASDARKGEETIGGKYNFQDGVLQENGKNLEVFSLGRAEHIAEEIGEQVKVAMDKKTGKFVVVKNDLTLAEGPKMTMTGPDNISDVLGSNSLSKNIKTPGVSIPTTETGSNAPIIIQKGGDTNNATVQQKSETYTGPLDTGIDPYFDRASYNSF